MDKTRKAKRLAETKAELAQVNEAIAAILQAQSYSVGSLRVQKADLATLYKRKDLLETLAAALEGGAGRFRRAVPVDG